MQSRLYYTRRNRMSRGYSLRKTLRGCAANMGSKISSLVYEWPLIKCQIWYTNGSIFSKFEPKLAQFQVTLWKIRWFCSKFGPKLNRLVYKYVTFSWKIGICIGLLWNSTSVLLWISVLVTVYRNNMPRISTLWEWWGESFSFKLIYYVLFLIFSLWFCTEL